MGANTSIQITAGIDIGSVATKSVILKGNKILAFTVLPTGAMPEVTARRALESALKKCNLDLSAVRKIVTTGYGRRTFPDANDVIDELHANARASAELNMPDGGKPRTIIDIGGQDSKVISLDNSGNLCDFVMNDRCAAGTGKFLEVVAELLEIKLEKLSDVALRSTRPATINSTCVVFAQSEIISLIAQKRMAQDIIAGVHQAIATRICNMVRRVGIRDWIVFNGGPAKNVALKSALEDALARSIYVPKDPQIVNAIGAALYAADLCEKK
jgi:predicted CoA-substrate-specific enzyme activase